MSKTEGTLQSVVGHWLPRMQTAGLTAADLDRVIAAAGDWPQWCRAFSEEAARHLADGEAAEALGRFVTAGEAYLRAALFFHFGQFMFFDHLEQKRAAYKAKVSAYRRAAPLLVPQARLLSVPFGKGALQASLRLPENRPAPLALLIPGSDSTKEEFPSLEHYFLDRGLATLSLDGPGQGEGRQQGPLTPNWSEVLIAVRDRLREEDAIDHERMGVMGMAFGGHLALQGKPDRAGFKAAISMNGFFDMGAFWDDLPPVYRKNMGFALGGRDADETEQFARRFSLAETPPPTCPILVIHGGKDRIFPIRDIESFKDWSPKAEIVIYDDGNHVCNNIAYRYRALMADWMAEKLDASPN